MEKRYEINGNIIEIDLSEKIIKESNNVSESIIFAFYKDKFVMSWYPERKGWKVPSGIIKKNETAKKCSRRSLFEETGAISNDLISIGYYNIYKDNSRKTVAVFTSEIEKFETKPDWSDTGIVKLFDKLPKKLFCDDLIYENIFSYITNKGLD